MNTIYDPMFLKSEIKKNLALKNITVKESETRKGLFNVKYTRQVFFNNTWDEFLRECRGLVIDQDYNVVVHPMRKVFNYKENSYHANLDLNMSYITYRKFNGFLGCVTNTEKHGLIFSTTGSMDSDFAKMFEEVFCRHKNQYFHKLITGTKNGATYYFEVCHENDPHIIREKQDLFYLGARGHGGFYVPNCDYLERHTLREMLASKDKIEGWMCELPNGDFFKVKTRYYLISKFFARANESKLRKLVANGVTQRNFLQDFDEDFLPIFEIIKGDLEAFIYLGEQERVDCVSKALENQWGE